MKNKIIALLLMFTLLSGTCAYAIPLDLWEYDSRFESLLTVKDDTITDYSIVHKVIDYAGIANKDNLRGKNDVESGVVLGAIAEIVGIKYEAEVEVSKIIDDLKAAKVLRGEIDEKLLTLQDLLYAAARITGWAEVDDIDAIVYSQAKKAGLLRSLEYSTERNLTKYEAAQLIYNIVSVPVKKPRTYEEGVTNLDKETLVPLLESKYGIVLKKGTVNSVFGESIFNDNKVKEDEIEINGITYDFNTEESRESLVGRSVAYFFEKETETVLFIEAITENIVYELNYANDVIFGADTIEFTVEEAENVINVNSGTIVVYNGAATGTYTAQLMNNYFKPGVKLTVIDNDDDGVCDVILVRKWDSFVAAYAAGEDGTVSFEYGMTYNGKTFINLVPEDKKTHITVTENGLPVSFTEIGTGDIVSISSSINSSGHKYIKVELAAKMISGTVNSVSGSTYIIDEKEYYVSEGLLNAYNTNDDVKAPETGSTYTFYIDIAGKVANVTVPAEYKFGFLVKLDIGRGIEPECNIKIFGEDGKMITVSPAKKVVLHKDANVSFTYNQDPKSFINKIVDEAKERAGGEAVYNGDYRSLIQYILNGKGELCEMWLPLDNTATTDHGKTGYQLTKDITALSGRTYYGAIWSENRPLYRLPAVPIFNVPGDLDGKDALYTVTTYKQNDYNGTISDKTPIEAYCIDEYNIIGAGVIRGASGEGDIDSYEELFIVDKIVNAMDENKEPVLKAYGWRDGEYTSYFTTELELISDEDKHGSAPTNEKWGWEVVKFEDLQFGDIIQVYRANDDVRRFRVIYRASNPGEELNRITVMGNINDSGQYDGQVVNYGTVNQMLVIKGKYFDRKENCLRISQNGDLNKYYMYTNRATDVYIIDMTAEKVTKTTVSSLRKGDTLMLRQEWGALNDAFVVR